MSTHSSKQKAAYIAKVIDIKIVRTGYQYKTLMLWIKITIFFRIELFNVFLLHLFFGVVTAGWRNW